MPQLTSKEKAIQLVDMFMDIGEEQEYNTPRYLSKDVAKQCALMSVNEMIEEYPGPCPKDSWEMQRHIYWTEVKQEIEKI